MLQQKLVTPGELQDLLESQRSHPGSKLASLAARQGRATVDGALAALAEQHGVPPVDLTAEVVPLSMLQLVPYEIAREHAVLPFAAQGDTVSVAMADPANRDVIEEVGFVTGKKVQPHVALDTVLRAVIEQAYERLGRGETHYVGSAVTPARLAEMGLSGLEPAPSPLEASEATEAPVAERPARVVTGPALDRAFTARARSSRPPRMPHHEPGAKVLIAMPAGPCRDAVAAALGPAAGLTLVDAFDGAQALERVAEHGPRAIVIEASLDNVHGFEVCRRLQSAPGLPGRPIIVVSEQLGGWRLEQDAKESLGIQYFFDAPVDVERLTRTVRFAIEGKRVPEEPPPLSARAEQKWGEAMDAFDAEDLDGAIRALEEACKLEPRAFDLQYHLGLLYGRRDDLFFAIQALERAVAAQPHHFSALKNLAVVYQRAGFHRKAVDSWQRALGEAPDEETRDSIKEHVMSLL